MFQHFYPSCIDDEEVQEFLVFFMPGVNFAVLKEKNKRYRVAYGLKKGTKHGRS